MKITYVLWGRKDGYRAWEEDLLAEVGTKNELATMEKIAKEKGYTHTRVLIHREGDRPDFANTIRI